MIHPWQQPIRPMEYSILNAEPIHDDATFTPFWYDVIFIRVTDDGFEVIGENGARWDCRAIIVREVVR
jgi:hypothetical protein